MKNENDTNRPLKDISTKEIIKKSNNHDVEAINELAYRYFYGNGIKKNYILNPILMVVLKQNIMLDSLYYLEKAHQKMKKKLFKYLKIWKKRSI